MAVRVDKSQVARRYFLWSSSGLAICRFVSTYVDFLRKWLAKTVSGLLTASFRCIDRSFALLLSSSRPF